MNILAAIFFSLTTIPPPIIVILVVNVDHLTFDSSCFNYLYFWVLHDCVSCASPRPPWVNLMTRNSWFCASSCRVSSTAGMSSPGLLTTPSWSNPRAWRWYSVVADRRCSTVWLFWSAWVLDQSGEMSSDCQWCSKNGACSRSHPWPGLDPWKCDDTAGSEGPGSFAPCSPPCSYSEAPSCSCSGSIFETF